MPEDLDKSLLERLQALRGSSPGASSNRAAPIKFSVDVIERSKPATREDTLAARLKSLRAQDDGSASSPAQSSPKTEKAVTEAPSESKSSKTNKSTSLAKPPDLDDGNDVDFMFSTDDQTLEELLGDVSPDGNPVEEPSDEQVKALLEELSRSVPKDEAYEDQHRDKAGNSDDSDGEHMQAKVNDIIAQFQDEAELETTLGNADNEAESTEPHRDEDRQDGDGGSLDADLALPSLPSNLDDLPTSSPQRAGAQAGLDDITARMAALRAPTTEDPFSLPSVPNFKPSVGDTPVKRLTSKTNYTDEDIDGCDDDAYCTRCWREMHIGPAAAFDDRSHKAVQITRTRKKDKQQRVALGA
ncbi:hypothetical protein TARUN_8609 [Trichoderma arundinaceum]|uniref:Uncharacterized protein n=1 Tax=Trichoderma arundinaceum TaxID=490622 RepID=A0A395NBX1_TRIAR|nr:hypothetical protein TARUN_8609 [Trichoderma arundinaceum]